MFLSAFFSTGRIIFIILFVLGFGAAIVWGYRKDIKNHERYYKSAGKKVAIYGGLIIAVFLFVSVLSFNYSVKYINVSVGSTIRSMSFSGYCSAGILCL